MGVERHGYNRSKTHANIVELPVERGRTKSRGLPPEERKVWNRMVAAMPHGYFGPANEHLLRALCSHVVTAEVVGAKLSKALNAKEDLETIDLLSKIQESSSRSIGDLSARLRLTPKSRYSQEESSHKQRLGSDAKTRPWEK